MRILRNTWIQLTQVWLLPVLSLDQLFPEYTRKIHEKWKCIITLHYKIQFLNLNILQWSIIKKVLKLTIWKTTQSFSLLQVRNITLSSGAIKSTVSKTSAKETDQGHNLQYFFSLHKILKNKNYYLKTSWYAENEKKCRKTHYSQLSHTEPFWDQSVPLTKRQKSDHTRKQVTPGYTILHTCQDVVV